MLCNGMGLEALLLWRIKKEMIVDKRADHRSYGNLKLRKRDLEE